MNEFIEKLKTFNTPWKDFIHFLNADLTESSYSVTVEYKELLRLLIKFLSNRNRIMNFSFLSSKTEGITWGELMNKTKPKKNQDEIFEEFRNNKYKISDLEVLTKVIEDRILEQFSNIEYDSIKK